MLVKTLLPVLLTITLSGCGLPYRVVHNELSRQYYNERDFFSDEYASLRQHNTLFSVYPGWYRRSEKRLTAFLNLDSLESDSVTLTRVDLIADGELFASSPTTNQRPNTQTDFGDYTLHHGGAQLAYEVQDIGDLLNKELTLNVHYRYRQMDSTMPIDIQLKLEWFWPT